MIQNNKPIEISIIIPTINSSIYISKTLNIINDELNQLGEIFEIIVINDNSKDNTLALLREQQSKIPNLKIINLNTKQGQRTATSIGYQQAKGKYIVTFDDDLKFSSENIPIFYNELKSKPEYYILSGYYENNKKHTINNFYYYIRILLIFVFNNIFFYKYKKKKYFTPFKIINKEALSELNIHNIFYFWNIPTKVLNSKRVILSNNTSFRVSNYNFIDYWIFFNFIAYKMVQKSIIFFEVLNLLILKNTLITFIFLFIFIIVTILLYKDKTNLKLEYDIY